MMYWEVKELTPSCTCHTISNAAKLVEQDENEGI